jgi:muramoyltetrapeptide carboxypeptidase LdcA involved in peptidoglycan recycling
MKYKKFEMSKVGDTVAVIAPSSGLCKVFPHIYKNGIKVLLDLGLKVVEYPTTKKSFDFISNNPKFRANDVNNAFKDKNIKAIFTVIGGNDCNRILPYLDETIIKNNPKIFMGFSDTATLNTYFNQLGLITFNGPSIMAGFSQMYDLEQKYLEHIKEILFNNNSSYQYFEYNKYVNGYLDWSKKENVGKVKNKIKNDGWIFLQGKGKFVGELYGGCIEVLEFTKSTKYFPKLNFFKNKILFFETSEDKPSLDQIKYMLRNYGLQGVFDKISGIIFGRARDFTKKEKDELNNVILKIVRDEFKNNKLPIITNFDIGHTDPQLILPLGIKTEIDCSKKTVKLVENIFVN